MTAAVASTHDVDEVLQRIAHLTAQAIDVTECDIYEYDPSANAMIWVAHYQRDPDHSFE